MIIGNGLIATILSSFSTDEKFIVFASGVSNSACQDEAEFKRETDMLSYWLTNKKANQILIYFSTFNVFDPSLADNQYVKHKINIENILIKRADAIIVRIPILLAKSNNPNTLINFISNKVLSDSDFEVFENASRYFINGNDLKDIITSDFLFKSRKSNAINLSHPNKLSIIKLINCIETVLNKKAYYKFVPKGSDYSVNDIEYPIHHKINMGSSYVLQSLIEIYGTN